MVHKLVNGVPQPANIRADFPNTSFPSNLAYAKLPEGYVWVTPSPLPSAGQYESIEPSTPVYDEVADVWRQAWVVQPWAPSDVQAYLTAAIQEHMDSTAKQRGYDGILSLATYATSPNPKFAAEGQAGVVWRDACWTKGYEVLAACIAGTAPIPSAEELISELPAFVWPEVEVPVGPEPEVEPEEKTGPNQG